MNRRSLLLAAALSGSAVSSMQAQAPASRYAPYPSPVSCLGTLMRTTVGLGWNNRVDTLPFDNNDILPQVARDSAADCLRRFYPAGPVVAKVPEHEVAGLFFWGRATGDDSLAIRAFRRGLAQQRIRNDSTDLYWHGAYSYSSRPFRLPVAQEMAKRLDELGVVGERPMLPYDDHWESQHDGPSGLAQALFDTTAIKVETAGELRNYHALADTARHGAELTGISSEGQMLLLELLRNPRADSAVAAHKAKAAAVLSQFKNEGRWGEGLQLLGDVWPTITPDFWFNRPGGDGEFPRKNRVTVIQYIGIQTCTCDNTYGVIRRLKRQFGDSLDIVIVAQTQGHWARRVQLAPVEEAALLQRALIDSLKLPIALGVYTTTFVPNPAPDDRLIPQQIPELHKIMFASSAIIVDRRGIAQLAGLLSLGTWNERAIAALVASLLKAPAN